MKSPNAIYYDFQRAINEAEDLEDAARRMRRLSEYDMENTKHSLTDAWQGDAANAYQKKCSQLQEKILDSAKSLENQASVIRSVARRTYEAEMYAYRLAIERNN